MSTTQLGSSYSSRLTNVATVVITFVTAVVSASEISVLSAGAQLILD